MEAGERLDSERGRQRIREILERGKRHPPQPRFGGQANLQPAGHWDNIAAKTTERLWKAFSLGALDVVGRVLKAGAGDVSDSERAYNLYNERLGLAGRQRFSEVNVEQALGFKVQPRHPRCFFPFHPRV
jgi:hypothetical protein